MLDVQQVYRDRASKLSDIEHNKSKLGNIYSIQMANGNDKSVGVTY